MRQDNFVDYTVFTESVLSRTAERGTNFKIAGQRTVKMYIEVDK